MSDSPLRALQAALAEDSRSRPLTLLDLERVTHAVAEELALRDKRLDAIDPVTRIPREIRPLHEIEREAIEYAVRELGSVAAAADVLEAAPATLYRKIKAWRAE